MESLNEPMISRMKSAALSVKDTLATKAEEHNIREEAGRLGRFINFMSFGTLGVAVQGVKLGLVGTNVAAKGVVVATDKGIDICDATQAKIIDQKAKSYTDPEKVEKAHAKAEEIRTAITERRKFAVAADVKRIVERFNKSDDPEAVDQVARIATELEKINEETPVPLPIQGEEEIDPFSPPAEA